MSERDHLISKLRALRDLYDHPNHWVKGKYSVDNKGSIVQPYSAEAVSWCLTGGANLVTATPELDIVLCLMLIKVLSHNIQLLYPTRSRGSELFTLDDFNDHPDTTIEDVRKVIEYAIRELQEMTEVA